MQLTPELLDYWKSRMEASDRANLKKTSKLPANDSMSDSKNSKTDSKNYVNSANNTARARAVN
jgi:hypothetical protein